MVVERRVVDLVKYELRQDGKPMSDQQAVSRERAPKTVLHSRLRNLAITYLLWLAAVLRGREVVQMVQMDSLPC